MNNSLSQSILEKRIKRFKSIKRGYYSLIIIISMYALSILSPLWINNKPLIVKFANGKYDIGEKYDDANGNNFWEENETYNDKSEYLFPAFWDLFDFLPGVNYPIYESKSFNQISDKFEVNFRLLDKECELENIGNFVIMPIYPYHPHEDLKDQLDEEYEDLNNNEKFDLGEKFIDLNNDGKWNQNNPPTKPEGFSGRHLMGTDNTGRDVFARVIDGFNVSMTFAIVCTILSYSIGIIIGALLGFFGKKIDLFGVRIMEIFSAMPFLFIMMILSGFMQPNLFILAGILVFLSGWIGIAYYIRGEFYREKAKDYVSAAVSMGASNRRVMFKHILPNALTPVITFAPFAIIGYIGTLNMLDLLGYGLQPPAASWGEILKQALENLDNWHMLVFPIISITITLFMITFIGEAIREAFDPKVYSRLR
jgi:microcin C transport system permease protein